ncbi:MAG: alpha/beta hydrolase [Elusimicrobiota bacterium]
MEVRLPAAAWLALTAVALWVGLRWFERAMVFSPMKSLYAHPGTVGLTYESLWLTAEDGTRLRAWWLPGPRADSPVMLCLHGNAGNISTRTDKMRIFHDGGAAQLWIDWRGYGESGGSPSERGLHIDAQAAWTWLTSVKNIPPARLVVYGESLGGGPAAALALRAFPSGLILDSTFTSIRDMAGLLLPWFPARLVKTRFDNLAKLPSIACPTLILHSPQDDVIPFGMARLNFAASGAAQKTLVELKGTHNEGFLETGPAYGAAIKRFLLALSKPREKV